MTVRRHTKVLADGERHLGKPKLQLALITSHLLSVAYCPLLVSGQTCRGLEEPFQTRLTRVSSPVFLLRSCFVVLQRV